MADPNATFDSPPSAPGATPAAPTPEFRPGDRFRPYAGLSEEPSDEELARLDGDLLEALLEKPPARPFSYTVIFAPFDLPEYEQAVELAKASGDYQETGKGPSFRHRARFKPTQVVTLHRLWELITTNTTCDILIDDRAVPFARELWLPLLWYLLPH
jgi:hypothetical protein